MCGQNILFRQRQLNYLFCLYLFQVVIEGVGVTTFLEGILTSTVVSDTRRVLDARI